VNFADAADVSKNFSEYKQEYDPAGQQAQDQQQQQQSKCPSYELLPKNTLTVGKEKV